MNCWTNVGGGRQGGILIDEARVDAESLRPTLLRLFLQELPVEDDEDAVLGDLVIVEGKGRVSVGFVAILSGDAVRGSDVKNRGPSDLSRNNNWSLFFEFISIA
jgi:hypothetical protein